MKKLTVVVDRDLCDAHGVCVGHAPGVFAIGEDDQMHLLTEHPTEEQLAGVRAAVHGCPKGALSLAEDD